MNARTSSISRLASVGSYLDALSSISDEMSLRERSNLIFLDRCLHEEWDLGQNVLLNWCPIENGIYVLVIPHYALAACSSRESAARAAEAADAVGSAKHSAPVPARPSENFFQALLSGRRQLEHVRLDRVARLLGIEPTFVPLRLSIANNPAQQQIVEKMVKRYSITYVPNRAVALFDIVGFSLLSPFEQMTQLNSLSYSLNSAQSKLLSKKIGIDFSRSTTGDGFYVWNRDLSLNANINLYHFMNLALADNAIARAKARDKTVPHLRACFHVGGSYEFHQSEGLNPTLYNYIVGDVTVELARMIEFAAPDQILVGEFTAQMHDDGEAPPAPVILDAIDFVFRATQSIGQLTGVELSGERVDFIKSYLTGARLANGDFTIRRIIVNDKHGISRNVYNAKANIYRRGAPPILLGIEDRVISAVPAPAHDSEHVMRAVGA